MADLPPCEQIEAMKKEAANVDPDEVARKQARLEHENKGKEVMAKSDAL